MELATPLPLVLGLLLLPLLAVLLMALCVRCRELPGEWELGVMRCSLTQTGIQAHSPIPHFT